MKISDRNRDLIKDYKSEKFTAGEIARKYKISESRVFQILRQHEIPTILKLPKKSGDEAE